MSVQSESKRFAIHVDGRLVNAEPGQSVAAALLAAGIFTFRLTAGGRPRGIFCGMGVCFDCLVTIDGLADQRACITPVAPGMRIETGVRAFGVASEDPDGCA
jgi:predicted molibdopterin-dependent oxidoreductase YjgC